MVGNVGYAPTTPRMSIEYSTIEPIPHDPMVLDYPTRNYKFQNYYFFDLGT